MTTIHKALTDARRTGVQSLDGQVLLGHVLGRERAWLLAHAEQVLDHDQASHFSFLLGRRQAGEPVAYLTGRREFFGLFFEVSPAVLIPRPETEHLVEAALEWAGPRQSLTITDVGTGSGAIAVSLSVHLPETLVIATDSSRAALEVAARNVMHHAVEQRVKLAQADLTTALRGPVDVIVSNPPYIPSDELSKLAVARHEPHAALEGGSDGLAVIRRLLADAPRLLAEEGLLLVEIGSGQGESVAALARERWPEADVSILYDYAGHERVLRVAIGEQA